jgi:hypothetical protein
MMRGYLLASYVKARRVITGMADSGRLEPPGGLLALCDIIPDNMIIAYRDFKIHVGKPLALLIFHVRAGSVPC